MLATPSSTGRRHFLKLVTAAGGGLAIGLTTDDISYAAADARPDAGEFRPNAFVRISPDGRITVTVGYSEMGQGIVTALPMIVAEELDADWSKVRFEQAPADPAYTNPRYGVQGTGGSNGIAGAWEPMRKAGASARAMLVTAASQAWGIDQAQCRTRSGYVVHPSDGSKLGYGELAVAASKLPLPTDVHLKDPRDFEIVGKSLRRLDTPQKSNGSAIYGMDVKLPGMLTAVIIRPPVIGAKVVKLDADKAKRIPGVRHVIQLPRGIAVVADGYWSAKSGREALEVTWDKGTHGTLNSASIEQTLREAANGGATQVARHEGDAPAALARTDTLKVEANYEVPFLAQACMEPMNFTAWVKPDGVEVIGGTQAQTGVQRAVAKELGLRPEQVKVTTTLLGGGFGRRFGVDYVLDAAVLSKELGLPIHVIYSREDDMRSQYYRPVAHAKMAASLDVDGQPIAAHIRLASPSIWREAGYPFRNGIDRTSVDGFLTWPYELPHLKVEWTQQESPVSVWFWRAVGFSQNVFFMEGLIDEMAAAARKDPLTFRLSLLSKTPRLRKALEEVAKMCAWEHPRQPGRHLGIACSLAYGTSLAQVVEISLGSGDVTVHRVWCAVDCGVPVNPQIIKNQINSSIVYGLSAALWGRISLKDGAIEQSNFHDYPVLRMSQMPAVDVRIIPSGEAPGGIGEAGLPPLAPAITSAIYAATKRRIRKLPLAESLKA